MVVRSSRSFVLALLVALASASGCPRKTSPPSSTPPPRETEAGPDEPDLPPPEGGVPDSNPAACAEGGRLWNGAPVDCTYEHGGCCYDSAADACAAAECPTEQCVILESYPAQISCSG